MSLRKLPQLMNFERPEGLGSELSPDSLERWNAGLRPVNAAADNTIDVFDVIGEDFWTGGGVTAKSVSARLKAIGDQPVTVNVNSPGGDFFEGEAIYNLLRDHKYKVTVRVMGMAASAASVIAMAGDRIEIAKAGWLMIHNTWVIAMGDRNYFAEVAETLGKFDANAAQVYADRSGVETAKVTAWMDAETWFSGAQAVDEKLADALLPADQVKEDAAAAKAMAPFNALRRADASMAKAGMPRGERRRILNDIKRGTHDAAAQTPVTRDAGLTDVAASLRRLQSLIQ